MFAEIQITSAQIRTLVNLTFDLVGTGLPITKDFMFRGRRSVVNSARSGGERTVVTTTIASIGGVSVATPAGMSAISQARIVRIELAVDLEIVALEDLESAGMAPTQGETAAIRLFFDLFVSAVQNGTNAQMRFLYRDCDLGPELGAAENAQAIKTEIYVRMQASALGTPIPLSSSAFASLAFSDVIGLHNVGATMDASESVVAVRMELTPPLSDSLSRWTAFYGEGPPNRMGSGTMALFVENGLILAATRKVVDDNLAHNETTGEFALSSPPSVAWRTDFPGVKVEISGEAVDLCPPALPFPEPLDLDVKIDIEVRFSVVNGGQALRMRIIVDGAPTDPAEVIACISMLAAFWPLVGGQFLSWTGTDSDLGVGAHIGGSMAGPLGMAIALGTLFANGFAPDLDIGPLQEVEDTDHDAEYFADTKIDDVLTLSSLPNVALSLVDVVGLTNGLQLNAVFNLFALSRFARLELNSPEAEGNNPRFVWRYVGECGDQPTFVAQFTMNAINLGLEDPPPNVPLRLEAMRILDDPLGQFQPHLIDQFPLIGMRIAEAQVLPAYQQQSYPCRILLFTNGGTRLVTIPPIPDQPDDKAGLYAEFKAEQFIRCKTWTHFFWGRIFNPLWHVDPPPYEKVAFRLWSIQAFDTMPGTRIEVALGDAAPRSSVSDRSGNASTQILSSEQTPAELQIAFHEPEGFEGRLSGRATTAAQQHAAVAVRPAGRLAIRQSLYTAQAFLRLVSPGRDLGAGLFLGSSALAVVVEGRVQVLDVSVASNPRWHQVFGHPAVEGAVFWRGELVSWGAGQVLRHRAADAASTVTRGDVIDVLVRSGHLHVLKSNMLEIFGARAEMVQQLSVRQGSAMRATATGISLEHPTGSLNVRLRRRHGCPQVVVDPQPSGSAAIPQGHLCTCNAASIVSAIEAIPGSVRVGRIVAWLTPNQLGLNVIREEQTLALDEARIARTRRLSNAGSCPGERS